MCQNIEVGDGLFSEIVLGTYVYVDDSVKYLGIENGQKEIVEYIEVELKDGDNNLIG